MALHPSGQTLPGIGTCRACGAPVAWALTRPGLKRIPLDPPRYADDDPAASMLVSGDHLGSCFARAETLELPRLPHERRHMVHFATCTASRAPGPRAED